MSLPHCETLLLEPVEGVLRITLNRPQSRNAMSLAMVGELRAVLADVAIAAADAQFGLPETSLGILPAQIAPFVVRRIGLTQARRLALTAARFDGREALRLGLVHFCEADADALEQRLEETLEQLHRCAPNANAATKALLLASESGELGALLDDAARQFAEAVGGAEGSEGTLAFVQKRKPVWAQ